VRFGRNSGAYSIISAATIGLFLQFAPTSSNAKLPVIEPIPLLDRAATAVAILILGALFSELFALSIEDLNWFVSWQASYIHRVLRGRLLALADVEEQSTMGDAILGWDNYLRAWLAPDGVTNPLRNAVQDRLRIRAASTHRHDKRASHVAT
jgi:hypothetical protein